jgi:hypothetical protein
MDSNMEQSLSNEQVVNLNSVNSFFKQCSVEKLSDRHTAVHSITATGFACEKVPVPRIGSMAVDGEADITKMFHGARKMRGGQQRNDVMTSTFDPATLNCVTCKKSHGILDGGPVAIIVTDQNFVPALVRDPEYDTGCVAIVRLEDASLNDLAELTMEIFEKKSVGTGSAFLLGSASHLVKAGVAAYAADWIAVNRGLAQKFKNINICPLIPLLFEDSPGLLARDLEILAVWLHKVYDTGMQGLSECWAGVVSHTQQHSVGHTALHYDDIVKLSLPATLSSPDTETFFFKFANSCPARLSKMDRKTIDELVRIITSLLRTNFSIAICSEGTLPRATPPTFDPKAKKHIVCIGSSIMKQTVPFLRAMGCSVTDLTRPGWLATTDNIEALISQMSKTQLEPGFSVAFELLGNASYRFEQFDGTQALPQKENGRYHMKGPVVICETETYKKIIRSLSPVLLSAQDAVKVLIPPLPRYVFSPCCSNPQHCTNLGTEGAVEKLVNGVTNLRNILKKECGVMNIKNHWVLDGVGALSGVPVAHTAGSNRELLPELKGSLADDGVHLSQDGTRKLALSIVSAINGVNTGVLTKSFANTNAGKSGEAKRDFFWRGYLSPVGDVEGRASNQHKPGNRPHWHKRHQRQFHPYTKK